MINERAVLRLKVPYPDINADLAVKSHMYVCRNVKYPQYSFVKCQTLKPYMLFSNIMRHYCDEYPDITRNPFKNPTRIDCDKLFFTEKVDYDDRLITDVRKDICQELFIDIIEKLNNHEYEKILINEDILIQLNSLINRIEEI